MKIGILESKKRNFSPAVVEPNLFIGGVANSIPNANALASKLNILESDITNFLVVGKNIQALINVQYIIPINCFAGDTEITFFIDYEKCIGVDVGGLANCHILSKVELRNATIVSGQAFISTSGVDIFKEISLPEVITVEGDGVFQSFDNGGAIYLPKAQTLGNTLGNDLIFQFNSSALKLYLNQFLQTSNNGNEEGDITYARSLGCEITYIANNTKPNQITDLTSSQKFATLVELDFTPPTSLNTVESYQVFVNGVYNSRYLPGTTISAISLQPGTNYNIQLVAIDEYYNKSELSNVLNITTFTMALSPVPVATLGSFYQLNELHGVVKNIFSENYTGTNYGCKRGIPGLYATAYRLNGSSNYFTIPNPGISTKASINFWVKLKNHIPTAGSRTGLALLNTQDASSHYPFTNGQIYLSLFSNTRKQVGTGIIADRTVRHMVTVTANEETNVWKFYQNAQLVFTGTVGSIGINSVLEIGRSGGTVWGDFEIDELSIDLTDLTQTQINTYFNNGKGITL
ncbi:hypothetical protein J0871_16830 [Salegentibacter sp. BDJ18]|uniref:fibronectin type III domain-containing protein n=1 Tax=Salegentibacter sp. BDJ18 TaxID=2816376 RepID=UPI001AAFCB00|nr:fibronectin type III domain-containing protein [Salegentibacter sp. BDJ18]MBO2546083.1 hypothetical protein [Salegentibacter sp. BDJ18]